MENKPRISKWISRGYIVIFIFIVILYIWIELLAQINRTPTFWIFFNVLIAVILVIIGATTYCFHKTVYFIKDGFLHSWSPFAVISLKLNDIKKAEATRIPFYIKGFGAGLYSGMFYIPSVGWTKVIITNLTDGVLITDKKEKHYLITPSNPTSFAKLLK